MNFIRIHEFPEVSNNGERQEIMETTTINLFKTFKLHDFEVLWARNQTIIPYQGLSFCFP